MQINELQQKPIQFTSLTNPIKPFDIKTSRGILHVRECTAKELSNLRFTKNITNFMFKNFASMTEDPFWLTYNNPTSAGFWKDLIISYAGKIRKVFTELDPQNATLLIAKDSQDKLRGVCYSFGFNELPNLSKRVCYIESLAVDPKFRRADVGRILIDKTINSAKQTFTDIFLTGDKMAEGFYKKIGFVPLNPENPAQNKIIKDLTTLRCDYPRYTQFLTKPLQIDKPRWYGE